MSFLEEILENKAKEVDFLRQNFGLKYYKRRIDDAPFRFHGFIDALNKQSNLSVIAEIKKASPSKGIIREHFDPVAIAKEFCEKGAATLSVLTEKKYFQGHPTIIGMVKNEVPMPVLRKDFIIDFLQVYEAKAIGADAILLIVACLDQDMLLNLHEAALHLGMDVLVEVHNEEELYRALAIPDLQLLGINNRNLITFDMDMALAPSLKAIARENGYKGLVVAESGYSDKAELAVLNDQKFDAVLIGEGLAKNDKLL